MNLTAEQKDTTYYCRLAEERLAFLMNELGRPLNRDSDYGTCLHCGDIVIIQFAVEDKRAHLVDHFFRYVCNHCVNKTK